MPLEVLAEEFVLFADEPLNKATVEQLWSRMLWFGLVQTKVGRSSTDTSHGVDFCKVPLLSRQKKKKKWGTFQPPKLQLVCSPRETRHQWNIHNQKEEISSVKDKKFLKSTSIEENMLFLYGSCDF